MAGNKFISSVIIVGVLAASVSTAAVAGDHRGNRHGNGAAIAAGLVGAVVIGSLIANSQQNYAAPQSYYQPQPQPYSYYDAQPQTYYQPAQPVYYAPQRQYYAPAPVVIYGNSGYRGYRGYSAHGGYQHHDRHDRYNHHDRVGYHGR